jgi:cell division protein YceG involved in septum cleavage
MAVKETQWSKHMTFIRDVVFIILFFASIIGWIRSETIKKTKLEDKIEQLTEVTKESTKQLEKVNDILYQQQILNGKIIQYMESNK